MKTRASTLRRIARANQNKHYWWAVLVSLVAMLLGGTAYAIGTTQPQLNFNFNFGGLEPLLNKLERWIAELSYGYTDPMVDQYFDMLRAFTAPLNLLLTLGSFAALLSLAALFIAGPMRYGYSRWSLQMHDAAPKSHFSALFSGFKHYGPALGLQWYRWLMLFLWSLLSGLFVLIGSLLIGLIFGLAFAATPELAYMDPGAAILTLIPTILLMSLLSIVVMLAATLPTIIAQYRYAMAYYLLVENPAMGAAEAIRCSKRIMKGNKWRLFCLLLSFIGWDILDALTFHILGLLFLNPYKELAVAAFYRDLVPANPSSQLWSDAPKARYQPVPTQGYGVPVQQQWQQPAQAPVENPPVNNVWYTPAEPAQPEDPFADLPKTEPVQQPDWGTPPEAPKNPWEQ